MKSFATLILAALPLVLADCPANGNNCARAVTGTRKSPDQASRSADCSSFMKRTVTPAAATVTSTVTVTINAAKRGLEARQTTVVPSAIPSYAATACSAAAYSSVCSCWGITAATVTVATPTVTVTATATATAVTDCPGGAGSCNAYTVYSCPESDNGCTCGTDANGATVCWVVGSCNDPSCTTNAECGTGKTCVTGTCCGSLCMAIAPAGRCNNPNVPRAIFGRKVVPRAGCEASPVQTC